jgi:hypothetical protein
MSGFVELESRILYLKVMVSRAAGAGSSWQLLFLWLLLAAAAHSHHLLVSRLGQRHHGGLGLFGDRAGGSSGGGDGRRRGRNNGDRLGGALRLRHPLAAPVVESLALLLVRALGQSHHIRRQLQTGGRRFHAAKTAAQRKLTGEATRRQTDKLRAAGFAHKHRRLAALLRLLVHRRNHLEGAVLVHLEGGRVGIERELLARVVVAGQDVLLEVLADGPELHVGHEGDATGARPHDLRHRILIDVVVLQAKLPLGSGRAGFSQSRGRRLLRHLTRLDLLVAVLERRRRQLHHLHLLLRLLVVQLAHRLLRKLSALKLHEGAHLGRHLRMLGHILLNIGRDGIAGAQNAHQDNLAAGAKDLRHALNGGPIHGQVENDNGARGRRLVVGGQVLQAAHLRLNVVDLETVGAFLDGEGHLAPVLGEVLDALEAGDELEADEALLVALDVLQQELVLRDVGVREVELDLAEDRTECLIEVP